MEAEAASSGTIKAADSATTKSDLETVVILPLSGDVIIEQDGDYKIDDEKCLPFEYKQVLGNGWSAVVEQVEHKQTKELFAKKVIKFPRSKGKPREQAKERFFNEVAIIRSLQTHIHIVRLFATYTTSRSGGLLLQPAADQGDLHDYLDRFADLVDRPANLSAEMEQMTKVLEQAFGCLSSGLVYMHKKGIRHKDIKPRNILIHQGIVIYTDFGASKDTTKDGQCTTEGAPDSLTRKYCAPEVLEFEKRNFTADIFSLGCVFIEMLIRLSRLSEPEGLAEACYSGIMDSLHDLLLTAKIPSKLEFLVCHVIDMTARDSLGRPTPEKVFDAIRCNKGFSCSDCYPNSLGAPLVTTLSAADGNRGWIWSIEHQDYYFAYYDQHQCPVYHWGKQFSAIDTSSRTGSVIEPRMPESAPNDIRALQGYTPHTGWYDHLDSSYRMRTGQEAQEFFTVGKVFAMLYAEIASDTSVRHPNDEAYTVVRFGQSAHTNIRRFVVVDVRRGFVNACGLGTYSGRGTLKAACIPAEHTIVYFSGTDPASCYIPGEYESGMTKEPIEVVPAEPSVSIRKESRIRFGKVYPIEMNVKVKDIGRVRVDQISALLRYWREENAVSEY